MLYWLILVAFASCILIKLYQLSSKNNSLLDIDGKTKYPLPPGPIGVPIFGFMPFLTFEPHKALQKMGEKYGPVFQITLGKYRVVVLHNYSAIKEAFKEDVFAGRPDLKMLEVRNRGIRKGLVCSEGKEWIEQRKFTVKQLRDLGFGKRSMEHFVHEELDELISRIRKDIDSGNTSINLQNRFNAAVLNTIWRITCGERYKHNDPILQEILKRTSADLAETNYTGPLLFLPWLVRILPRLTRWYQFLNSIQAVHEFLQTIITQHKQRQNEDTFAFNPDDNSPSQKDFIDTYLLEIQKCSDPESSFFQTKGEHFLQVVLLDIFMAGADTTSTTLNWAFLFMILNQNVQCKIHEEIDSVIGKEKPRLEHRKRMPYTEATIMEILRKSSLVPLGLFHSTTSSTNFYGYFIPKDTVIMANLYNVHNSTTHWNDPEQFRPERFLNNSTLPGGGQKFESFLPFSTGKRVCPGESLAKDQLFLFIVGLLQQFQFDWDNSMAKPSEKPNIGVILSPKPYFVHITYRDN